MKNNLLSALIVAVLPLVPRPATAQLPIYTSALLTGTHDVTVTQSATGPDGLTVACGTFYRTAAVGTTTLTTPAAQAPAGFVGKMSGGRQWRWVLPINGTAFTYAETVGADAAGNTYVAGTLAGRAVFGNTALVPTGSQDVFIAKVSPGGQWLWAQQIGATTPDPCYVGKLAVTPQGRVVIAGSFRGRVNLGPLSLTSLNQTFPPFGPEEDAYIACLDAAGNWLWAHRAGADGYDGATGVGLDAAGNAYVTGIAQPNAVFDSVTMSATTGGAFVTKYDPAGNVQWVAAADRTMGQDLMCTDICTDAAANIYLVGYFGGTATFGSFALTSAGGQDLFIAALNLQGDWQWVQRGGGPGDDRATAVATALHPDSRILTVAGSFQQTAQISGQTLTSEGGDDIFVALLEAGTGTAQTGWSLGGPNSEFAASVHGISGTGQVQLGGSFYYDSPLNYGTGLIPNATARNGYLIRTNLQPTGLPDDFTPAELILWPNPARETVQLHFPNTTFARNAQLLDLTGRVIQQLEIPAGAAITTISLTDCTAGVYIVRCGAAAAQLVVP